MALSNPLQDVTGGDPGLARHLADSLRTLQRHSPDQEFTKLIDDVLSGRAQLRDVVRTVAFGRVLDPLVGKFAEKYNELDGDSRAALAAEGELQLSSSRDDGSPAESPPPIDDEGGAPTPRRILSSEW
ncbi:hypothetical protein MWT96_04125 [Prescottella equi]|uniref:Uncharacterized protein n=1 Tax=Rhodococcus hoagii TaxID=43767 RepID=A0A9Q5F1U8_RHOHA|nr:hypothetical protein [Prescottella equi]MBM4487159.1 hypothetical protein [Prescottella equi]MBM4499945.1 hypothetical protein [Prescottella equi]MBM4505129.1 hypothetical protein [Prescottella equi]MBM4514762.1 hypothetical protein [Prescottella equi]MBM4552279.1 hypothetical protein [Prescottella equi]